MSPSRPFILRPVATSLLMAAILLAGIVAYHAVAGFGAAAGRLPDDSGAHLLSRRQPRRDGHHGDGAAGTPVRPDAGAEPDDLDQRRRRLGHRAAVQPFALPRRGRGRGAVVDQRRADFPAFRSARAAGLQQDQSRRRAGPDAGHHLRLHAALAGRGHGGHAAGAEALAVERRGPGQHQRRPEAGGPHSGQPGRAVVLRPEHGGRAHGA